MSCITNSSRIVFLTASLTVFGSKLATRTLIVFKRSTDTPDSSFGHSYIGEVTKVENDQYGLAKQVRVKTGADMTDLTHVYVAKRDVSTIPDEGSDN